MPMSRARRLAPQATVIPPRHDVYAEVSAAVMALLRSLTPLVEPLASDEAFLDVSGARRRLGSPVSIGQLIRDRVADEQGITCSVGIATSKFVAKLATTMAKPDGLLVVPAGETISFLHPLPVDALWGVGEATAATLSRLGLRTIGDLAATPRATLQRVLGRTVGAHLHDLAWGRDDRPVIPHEPDRSIGAEHTFDRDVDDPLVVRRTLLDLAERTAVRARRRGRAGRTVTLKVRFADFTTLTRARTLPEATDVARELYLAASGLYDGLHLQRARIRLVGVRLEGLTDVTTSPRQLALTEPGPSWREAEQAADRASARFGAGVVRPASLLDGPDTSR
jgi:DNA polymerase-4